MTITETEADIRCDDLVRIFTAEGVEVQALQGLDLRVERGELVAIVGASGSGKSTLLTILSGLDMPTAGVGARRRARPARDDRRERVEYRRRSVGFVWQQTAPQPAALPHRARERRAADDDRRGAAAAVARAAGLELLDLLGVADCADRRPAELSGGEQQRVAIAVAMANDPAGAARRRAHRRARQRRERGRVRGAAAGQRRART